MMRSVPTNPRAVQAWDAFVEAGLRVVEELRLTEDELHAGARKLQQIAKEGFLVGLVDAAFATTAALTAAADRGVAKANLEGPLYAPGAPCRDEGVVVTAPTSERALPLTVTGRVYDAATEEPIEGAVLDFWQADEFGNYHPDHLRGKIRSSADGSYTLRTVVPEAYTLHADDAVADLYALLGRHAYRAAHIHVKVWVDGTEVLTTQFFDSGSRFLDTDYVVGAVRPELVVARELDPESSPEHPRYRMRFDIPVTRPA